MTQVREYFLRKLLISHPVGVSSLLFPLCLYFFLTRLTHISLALFDQPTRKIKHMLKVVTGEVNLIRHIPHPPDIALNLINELLCLLFWVRIIIPKITLTIESLGSLKIHTN